MLITICHRHKFDDRTVRALEEIAARLLNLLNQGTEIMSKITDYTGAVETKFGVIKDDLTTISGQATGLKTQIAALQAQITAGSSELSDEDNAALTQLVTDAGALADTADTAAGKVTPPTPPADTTQA